MTQQALVLDGVTIVATHDGTLTHNMAVVIEHDTIVKIAPAGSVGAGDSVRTIDARGKYVVPGYNDLHAHPLSSSDPEGSLTLMLALGITGFREMAGKPEFLEARKHGRLMPAGELPELLELPGEILTPANAPTPERAVAEVQKQKTQGADFIKFIDGRADVFFAALAESTRQNLPMLGHLPPRINVREAATAGMRSIEHLGPRDSLLLGCSSEEDALREMMEQSPPPQGPPITGPVPEAVIRRVLANPTLVTNPAEYPRYQRVIETFSASRCRDLAEHLAAAGMWQVPTLIRIRTMEVGDDPIYRNDPNLRYVPQQTRAMWQDVSQDFSTKLPPQARETLRQLFPLQLQLIAPFKAAGVRMLAGSDLGGGWVIAGFGLHQEFDLLEEAGLTGLDVLQMTTLNGAKYLGREARMGSVAAGKDANLVLLDADPIASVQHLHGIAGVVRGGAYHSAAALDALKKKTEERVAAGVPNAPFVRPACC